MKNICKTLSSWLTSALWLLETALFLLLALLNLRYFSVIRPSSGGNELIEFQNDGMLGFLPVFFLGIAAVLLCAWLMSRTSLQRGVPLLLTVVVGAVTLWWAMKSGYVLKGDQNSVVQAARRMLEGDFSDMQMGEYLFNFPYQIGITAFLELQYRWFGSENQLPFTILNCAANIGSYLLLWKIGRLLFGDGSKEDEKRFSWMMALLLAGCLAGVLPVNFVYGNLLGSFWSILALYLLLCWHKLGRWPFFAGACLSIALAVQFKLFSLIFLIAMAIFLLIDGLRQKKLSALCLLAVMLLSCAVWQGGIKKIYELRAGQPMPQGHPLVLTLAMGMQDNWAGWRAPGWTNTYHISTYDENNYDAEACIQQAKQDIQSRITEFAENPGTAVTFYKLKTISQWTEPTYQGFWLEYDWFHPEKYDAFMTELYTGNLQDMLVRGMKWYQTAIWVLAFFCFAGGRKTMRLPQLLPGLVILGGFLFSLLWEGKSQYILPYFMLAVPYAATGLACLTGWFSKALDGRRRVLA